MCESGTMIPIDRFTCGSLIPGLHEDAPVPATLLNARIQSVIGELRTAGHDRDPGLESTDCFSTI